MVSRMLGDRVGRVMRLRLLRGSARGLLVVLRGWRSGVLPAFVLVRRGLVLKKPLNLPHPSPLPPGEGAMLKTVNLLTRP
jgi:hypothetical protein